MTPRKIFSRLESVIGIDGEPRRLVTAIEFELSTYFGQSAIAAAELAEIHASAVADLILKKAADSEQSGEIITLVVLGEMQDVIAGFCFILPTDAPGLIAAKGRRRGTPDLLLAIQALSFKQFEVFGARVLSTLGATSVTVTPHSGDQGIDFYGRLSVGQFLARPEPFARLAHDVVVSLAGQAKHYESPIGPDVIRELVGALSLARTKTFSQPSDDIFNGLALKPFSPLVMLYSRPEN